MNLHDLTSVLQWWVVLFLCGLIFLPLTSLIFKKFYDFGYLFSKVIGIALISYTTLIFGELKILPFNNITIAMATWIFVLINIGLLRKKNAPKLLSRWKIFLFEEILFLSGITFWSFIRAHEPSINGLEKFMDFGFLNSILRSSYFPPTDMWFPPLSINYYYFGHLTVAVLTKLSFLPSYITFNLMIATLFSFTFSLSFSLGMNFIERQIFTKKGFIGGILSAVLVTFAGNLHTIYTFFKPYDVNNPVPFWNVIFSPGTFPNSYWYPNATRFIPFTIHEFPIYSFVVSDMHGHLLDIIFILLIIALTYIFYLERGISKVYLVIISFFLAVMYMTNAWDGGIYLLLISLAILIKNSTQIKTINNLDKNKIKRFVVDSLKPITLVVVLFYLFSLPFNLFFDSSAIVHGIGVVCAPDFLTKIGKIGPFLFEANHCQKTTWWELLTLYGFFYFFVISFLFFLALKGRKLKLLTEDTFIVSLIVLSTILILIPEFAYLKDIYPEHYRANTMFKLVYESFIMLSLATGYIIVQIFSKTKNVFFYLVTFFLLTAVLIYPYFAIKSYYADLKTYRSLNGISYLKTRYPGDYDAINWINKNIKGRPVIVEAQGDSYTDYERISANTGLPTILGWTVHEWLWRGTYDVPAPRITEVKNIYESGDLKLTHNLLRKYEVKYVYIGTLEYQKYPNLIESKFEKIGKVIFNEGQTKIYKLSI